MRISGMYKCTEYREAKDWHRYIVASDAIESGEGYSRDRYVSMYASETLVRQGVAPLVRCLSAQSFVSRSFVRCSTLGASFGVPLRQCLVQRSSTPERRSVFLYARASSSVPPRRFNSVLFLARAPREINAKRLRGQVLEGELPGGGEVGGGGQRGEDGMVFRGTRLGMTRLGWCSEGRDWGVCVQSDLAGVCSERLGRGGVQSEVAHLVE
ncbi:hypothetical protein NEOLEDRAFT_705852 [Neolentinus lepideus HHB14362 ss-1]|uniref:Uncharacterized protein n=1 Tax=Neolentinus lepideus HHB14362 ss-1 TaxID=1314782 RepID=A0A165V5T3_9AGAM|nr:hypothetical protein NEOLEDRAFT_705852 [Neolentinus lepideus HHB14362 ss-1]